MQQNVKILRPTVSVRILCLVICIVGGVIVASRVPDQFRQITAVAYGVLGVVWLTDLFRKRVVLHDSGLEIVSGSGSRVIPRTEIERVTWEKGCGASLKLCDGSWIGLPNVGLPPQSITNTIRAWLKKTGVES